jgi:hypothetical protein
MPPSPAKTVDIALLLLVCLSFSAWLSLHVALAITVGKRLGAPQGWLSFVAIPFSPYLGWRAGAKTQSVIWTLLVTTYASLLFCASR